MQYISGFTTDGLLKKSIKAYPKWTAAPPGEGMFLLDINLCDEKNKFMLCDWHLVCVPEDGEGPLFQCLTKSRAAAVKKGTNTPS